MGIWVFYYLRYTDYAGVGLIETIVFATSVMTEIPTGAVADLLGKKKTILLAFLIEGAGNIMMGLAPNFAALLLSLPFLAIGTSLFSGTFEALIYDSLKDEKKEGEYDRVIGVVSSIRLVTFAAATVIGGLMYAISPGLPFLTVGGFYFVGAGVTLLLREPNVDTEKFSYRAYIRQTKQGFLQLFGKTKTVRNILLLGITAVLYAVFQSLNDILGVEFGFSEQQWGVVSAVIFIVAAAVSGMTGVVSKWLGRGRMLAVGVTVTALSLVITPIASMAMGGVLYLIRYPMMTLVGNITSVMVNEETESKHRATTLSTFNLLAHLPYAIGAYFLGSLMQVTGAKWFAVGMGGALILVLGGYMLKIRLSQKTV